MGGASAKPTPVRNQHKPTQTNTNQHKPTQTNTNQHKPTQTNTNQHKPTQTNTNQYKPTQTAMKSVKKLMKKLTVVGEDSRYFRCCDSETTLFLPEDLRALVARSLVEKNSVSMRIMELGRSASSEIWNDMDEDGPLYLDDCLYLQVSQTRKPHLLIEPTLPVDDKLWHIISVIDGGKRFCPHCMDAEQAQGYFDQFRNDADTTVRCEESGSDSPFVGELWAFAHFERVPTALYNLEKKRGGAFEESQRRQTSYGGVP